MKKVVVISSLLGLMFSQVATSATSAGVPMLIQATVLSSCLVTTNAIIYTGFAPDATAEPTQQADIAVVCTAINTPYNVLISKGTGTGATTDASLREMRVGGAGVPLKYSLYQNAARTLVWGDTIGSNTVTGTGSLVPTTHTVYSKIFTGQSVPTGVYTDTVMVSVVY